MEPSEQVERKSIDDDRSRRFAISLPLASELFYAMDGHFVRSRSTTAAMQQFLMARAIADENVRGLARAIEVRATLEGLTPRDSVGSALLHSGYDWLDNLDDAAIALCVGWGINPTENLATQYQRDT